MTEKIQHNMAEVKISIYPTRGRHFFTIQSNLTFVIEKPKISTAKESQSTCLLYPPQILFLRGAFIFFSYGNSGLYGQCCPQFHPSCVQYNIAIFTVERTRISE